jgi:hypothetical protein
MAASDHPLFTVALKLQTDLANKSSQGKLIIVGNTGRQIQHNQPKAVIYPVREVVEAVRDKRQLVPN